MQDIEIAAQNTALLFSTLWHADFLIAFVRSYYLHADDAIDVIPSRATIHYRLARKRPQCRARTARRSNKGRLIITRRRASPWHRRGR